MLTGLAWFTWGHFLLLYHLQKQVPSAAPPKLCSLLWTQSSTPMSPVPSTGGQSLPRSCWARMLLAILATLPAPVPFPPSSNNRQPCNPYEQLQNSQKHPAHSPPSVRNTFHIYFKAFTMKDEKLYNRILGTRPGRLIKYKSGKSHLKKGEERGKKCECNKEYWVHTVTLQI